MLTANIFITLKKSVLDPQGKTVSHALEIHGFPEVQEVRCGKFIQIRLIETDAQIAAQKIEQMCQKLLANPVTEEFRYEIINGGV